MQIDMRVMELLASKLCHDLVSPVSAINNGVELIDDIGGSVIPEAMKLIGNSGATAARRLRLYRLAYGRAGSEASVSIKDARQIAEQYLADTKVSLVWPEGTPPENIAEKRGFLKTLMNLVVLAEETLAYGGSITVRNTHGNDGCVFEMAGRNASLSLSLQEAVDGSVSMDDLTPRSIQAYLTGRFADHFGFKLTHNHSAIDRLDLSLILPPPAVELPTPLTSVC